MGITRLAAGCVLLSTLGLMAACSDDASSSSADPLVVAISGEPTSLDPQGTSTDPMLQVTSSVTEPLTRVDGQGQVVGVLAESAEQDPEDPKRWILELREGINFSDGTEFNADAVVANVERILDPDFRSDFLSELGTLSGAEAVDEFTVALTTAEPDPMLNYELQQFAIVSPDTPHEPENKPIGTGPYVIDAWDRGKQVVLEANDDYWGSPKPVVEEIQIEFIPDVQTRMAALKAEDIDIAFDPPLDQLVEAPQLIETNRLADTLLVRLNLDDFPLSDPRFRQALSYAIDLDQLNDALFDGRYKVSACQPAVPSDAGFNPDLEPYDYDVDRAKALIEELALPSDFTLALAETTALGSQNAELSQALAGFWQEIGVKTEVQQLDLDAYLAVVRDDRAQSGATLIESSHDFGSSSRQLSLFVTGTVSTVTPSATSSLTEQITNASTSSDPAVRDDALRQIWAQACSDAWLLPLVDAPQFAAATARVNYNVGDGTLAAPMFNQVTMN